MELEKVLIKEFREAENLGPALIKLDKRRHIRYIHPQVNEVEDTILELLGIRFTKEEIEGENKDYPINLTDYLRTDRYLKSDKMVSMTPEAIEQFIQNIGSLIRGHIRDFEIHPEKEGNGNELSEPNGEKYHFHFYGIPSCTPEGEEIFEILITDQTGVTKFKREHEYINQQLGKVNEELERLANIGTEALGIAHDIKGPLTTLANFARRIGQYSDDERIMRYVGIIMDEAEGIQTLLQDLLDYTKPSMDKTDIDLNSVVRELCEDKKYNEIAKPKVNLDLSKENLVVNGNHRELYRVILNLVGNALQKKDVENIWINTYSEDDLLVLKVKDDGEMIKPEDKERIFNPFFTTKKRGTGLGLAICDRIIRSYGGGMESQSIPESTTFLFYLPLEKKV